MAAMIVNLLSTSVTIAVLSTPCSNMLSNSVQTDQPQYNYNKSFLPKQDMRSTDTPLFKIKPSGAQRRRRKTEQKLEGKQWVAEVDREAESPRCWLDKTGHMFYPCAEACLSFTAVSLCCQWDIEQSDASWSSTQWCFIFTLVMNYSDVFFMTQTWWLFISCATQPLESCLFSTSTHWLQWPSFLSAAIEP